MLVRAAHPTRMLFMSTNIKRDSTPLHLSPWMMACYFPSTHGGGDVMRFFLIGWLLISLAFAASAMAAERQGTSVEIKTAYGTYFDAYLAGAPDSVNSVLIIHDRWGLDNLAMSWADRFAAQGYLALAIDLYDGRVAKVNDYVHATHLMREMAPGWVDANLKAALAYLNAMPRRKLSVVGFGYGGSAAMRATILEPFAVISTVNIFGHLPQDVEQLRVINGPVLTLYSEQDTWVGQAEIDTFERLMFKLRNALQSGAIDAKQGFLDPAHAAYKGDEADRVWQRVLGFVSDTQ
jgi:carboxymethylenebutenolidase